MFKTESTLHVANALLTETESADGIVETRVCNLNGAKKASRTTIHTSAGAQNDISITIYRHISRAASQSD